MIDYPWQYWPNSLAGQAGTAVLWLILLLLPPVLHRKGWRWSHVLLLELTLCSALLLCEQQLLAGRWHSWNLQSGELRYADHTSQLAASQVLQVWSVRYGRGRLGDCHLELQLQDGSYLRSITVDGRSHDCKADARQLNQQLKTR